MVAHKILILYISHGNGIPINYIPIPSLRPRSLTRRLGGPDLVPVGLVRVTMTIRMMMS